MRHDLLASFIGKCLGKTDWINVHGSIISISFDLSSPYFRFSDLSGLFVAIHVPDWESAILEQQAAAELKLNWIGMMEDNRAAQLEEIAEEIRHLTESPLYGYRLEHRYHPVIGEGDLHATIMFIGEAPGEQEAKSGRPFVGASGRVLAELLESIGLERKQVYITNVVKDRPPENRDPSREEIRLYTPFLFRQIEIIRPKVIATLGRFAMDFVLEQFALPEKGQKIGELHGMALEAQTSYGTIAVVPLYHPAVALYSRNQRNTLEEDFQVLKQFI
jgi:uracil-DNA glycosylase